MAWPRFLSGLTLAGKTSDPAGVGSGDIWYRSDLDQIRYNSGGSNLILGPDILPIQITIPGLLVAAPGVVEFPVPFDCTFESVIFRVGVQPTGATTLKLDVNYDGTTIFGTQTNRPTWVASTDQAVVSTPSVTSFAAGHYWTIDVDAVGSTIPGSHIAGFLICRRT